VFAILTFGIIFAKNGMELPEQTRFYVALGNNIRNARIKENLSQQALAGKIGLTRVSVVNIEKGRQKPPLHQLYELAQILKVDLQTLFPSLPSNEEDWKNIIAQQAHGDIAKAAKLTGFLNQIGTSSLINNHKDEN
jgi:transcriptional regulator with XRE-family HTH domain